jgi:S-adenosyl methyltransferase
MRVTAQDIIDVAQHGRRTWQTPNGPWTLLQSDLAALDPEWTGDADDLQPMTAQTIAGVLNERRPWEGEDDAVSPLGWADGVDTTVPSVARIYDYYLGGSHNFEVDREAARKASEVMPGIALMARTNREFLHRAVRFMVGAGVRQFLDIGSGIPTVGNVHEIAQLAAPDARVMYVDLDVVAATHSRQILIGNDRAGAIREDVRKPEAIMNHPATAALLDRDQPIGVLMVSLLHFITDDDDPSGIIARFRDALAPGSYLALTHVVPFEAERVAGLHRVYDKTTTPGGQTRTREEVERLFDGFELVEPGLVWLPLWRPDRPSDVPDDPERIGMLAGVGRKIG